MPRFISNEQRAEHEHARVPTAFAAPCEWVAWYQRELDQVRDALEWARVLGLGSCARVREYQKRERFLVGEIRNLTT